MAQPITQPLQAPQPVETDDYAPPAGASEFAMWIGVVLIGVMFTAGCIGYGLVTRNTQARIDVPIVFWFSTLLINVSSAVLYYAMLSDKYHHLKATRRAVIATALLGLGFLVLQVPGIQQVLAAHQSAIAERNGAYAVMLILVSLHAAHVLVGLVAMTLLARRVICQRDVGHQPTIRLISIYWHGLTVIWLAMFSLLMFAR